MADLSKIRKNGVDYDIKDSVARAAIEELQNGENIDLSGYVQSVNGISPDANGNVDVAGGSGCDVSVEGEKLFLSDSSGDINKDSYELIKTITASEDVNSIYEDLPNCKALIVTYKISAIDSLIHIINNIGFTSGTKVSVTFTVNILNMTVGARFELYPKNGYYTGTGYMPNGSYNNVSTAMAMPNDFVAVIKDTEYINSITVTGYNSKLIPAGTVIKIWGVRA